MIMKRNLLLAALAASLALTAAAADTLRVAAVQMRSTADHRANVATAKKLLADSAARGAQIAAFPECAISGYDKDAVHAMTERDIAAAERELAEACRASRIAAVIGLPRRRDGKI